MKMEPYTIKIPNAMRLSLLVVVLMVVAFFTAVTCFAQTVVFSQNFNSPGTLSGCGGGSNASSKLGTFNTGATGTYAGKENKGDYATICSGNCTSLPYKITNNSDDCAAGNADDWKTQTNTGNDGGGFGDYALIVDGCASCAAAGDASVWCVRIAVSTNEIYNFSAYYSSPWLQSKANDPGLYLTINGVKLGGTAIVDQSLSSSPTTAQPYNLQSCYYQIPAGFSADSVDFCINMIQTNGGTDGVIGSGTYNTPYGQGNDFSVDDITVTKYTSGTTSGCTYTGTTPVELVSFSVRKEGNNAALQWTTASEQNASYFSIEKSEDAIHFAEIGMVKAQGNSSNLLSYGYPDRHFNGISYYRLKMIDKEGSYKYSGVIALTKEEYARLISSSDKGELQINAVVAEDTQWNLAVYSLMGQEYLNEKVSLVKGENTILKPMRGGEQSAKIVRIISEDGEVILSEIIVW
jgi:hypothetical protein